MSDPTNKKITSATLSRIKKISLHTYIISIPSSIPSGLSWAIILFNLISENKMLFGHYFKRWSEMCVHMFICDWLCSYSIMWGGVCSYLYKCARAFRQTGVMQCLRNLFLDFFKQASVGFLSLMHHSRLFDMQPPSSTCYDWLRLWWHSMKHSVIVRLYFLTMWNVSILCPVSSLPLLDWSDFIV